jgi:hypothetical protein
MPDKEGRCSPSSVVRCVIREGGKYHKSGDTVVNKQLLASVACAAALCLTCAIPVSALSQTHPHVFMNAADVAKMRAASGPLYDEAYSSLMSRIDYKEYLTMAVPTVTASTPDTVWGGHAYRVNDYWTEQPYFPGTDTPNSAADRQDYRAVQLVSNAVRDLAIAWTITGTESYATRAFALMKAWCVTPATRMNAHNAFLHPQSRIELSSSLPGMIYGMDLLYNNSNWKPSDKAEELAWVDSLANETPDWIDAYKNNFRGWGTHFVAAAAALLDDPSMMQFAWTKFKACIDYQLYGVSHGSNAGQFWEELTRDNSLEYSLFALSPLIETAHIADRQGIDGLWTYTGSDGQSLKMAMDYHAPYLVDPDRWPNPERDAFTSTKAVSNGYQTYEFAFLKFPTASLYKAVIEKYGRPVYDIRTAGPITLTHGISSGVVSPSLPAPVSLAPSAGIPDTSLFRQLSWRIVQGAVSYDVQLSTDSLFSSRAVDTTGVTDLTVNVGPLTAGDLYYWRVRAHSASMVSDWSAVRTFRVAMNSPYPNLVSNPSFERGAEGWSFSSDGRGEFVQSSPGYDDSLAARVSVVKTGANTQLCQRSVFVEPDSTYQLTFAASANASRTVTVSLLRDDPPFTNYGLKSYEVQLTTTWRLFSVQFKGKNLTAPVANGCLQFMLAPDAKVGDVFAFDDVRLFKLPSEQIPPEGNSVPVPTSPSLEQNYPNPFNPKTVISSQLPVAGWLRIGVYDLLGREVAVLVDEYKAPGVYRYDFDGSRLSSGVYICQMIAGQFVECRKMVLAK